MDSLAEERKGTGARAKRQLHCNRSQCIYATIRTISILAWSLHQSVMKVSRLHWLATTTCVLFLSFSFSFYCIICYYINSSTHSIKRSVRWIHPMTKGKRGWRSIPIHDAVACVNQITICTMCALQCRQLKAIVYCVSCPLAASPGQVAIDLFFVSNNNHDFVLLKSEYNFVWWVN